MLAKGYLGVHELTDDVLDGMRAYLSVAPAHNVPYLEAIGVMRAQLPEARLVGVFETAFHRTIPEEHRVYPVPYEWYERYGVMKMGYHGASHGYIAQKLSGYRRVISCHLGGSGSICAILDGQSIDNSFGFSLQAGVPHASRTGDVDVYLVPFLLKQGLTLDEIYEGFGKNGGLKGISGTSGAMLALKVMVTSILRYIGAYVMELGGLDALAFTGGIGENSARLRKMILERMAFMGIMLDETANASSDGERKISAPGSAADVFVIPANEEYMVVNETYKNCLERQ